ncbi:hypothetical protein GV827_10365 [Sulfitobacter sp. JBTF-M27]|uniref:Pilus assembly protein n=1 Tax=Sulfitobacter sediminilitoris TaxID=2698830 RepID=A0A6P0CEI5_9RHOB|nr:hypothetical protein [Sulfitobacter sediminilitoris]NEK22804.1 hypothetical protein [Sulfitobacter sediminilitoris]
MIKNKLQAFCKDTSGAVTVDWIVLTAAVVALAAVTIGVIQTGSAGLADNTGDYITDYPFF